MKVRCGPKLVTVDPIEWTDRDRARVVAFFVTCPGCRRNQWTRTDKLYIAVDGSSGNMRCRFCGRGKPKKRMYGDPVVETVSRTIEFPEFQPKCVGWRSLSTGR